MWTYPKQQNPGWSYARSRQWGLAKGPTELAPIGLPLMIPMQAPLQTISMSEGLWVILHKGIALHTCTMHTLSLGMDFPPPPPNTATFDPLLCHAFAQLSSHDSSSYGSKEQQQQRKIAMSFEMDHPRRTHQSSGALRPTSGLEAYVLSPLKPHAFLLQCLGRRSWIGCSAWKTAELGWAAINTFKPHSTHLLMDDILGGLSITTSLW